MKKPMKTLKELGEVVQWAVDRAGKLYERKLGVEGADPGIIIYDDAENEYEIVSVGQTSLLPDIEIEIRKIEVEESHEQGSD